MENRKAINICDLNRVLGQTFKTKRIINSGNCIGYLVRLDRSVLPVTSEGGDVKGADLIAMLSKLNEWEQTISEVRQGLLDIIESQLTVIK
ncbi:hypothetical protein D3C75_795310 [compost metagenome]